MPCQRIGQLASIHYFVFSVQSRRIVILHFFNRQITIAPPARVASRVIQNGVNLLTGALYAPMCREMVATSFHVAEYRRYRHIFGSMHACCSVAFLHVRSWSEPAFFWALPRRATSLRCCRRSRIICKDSHVVQAIKSSVVRTSYRRPAGKHFTASDLSLIHISEPTRQAEISYAV